MKSTLINKIKQIQTLCQDVVNLAQNGTSAFQEAVSEFQVKQLKLENQFLKSAVKIYFSPAYPQYKDWAREQLLNISHCALFDPNQNPQPQTIPKKSRSVRRHSMRQMLSLHPAKSDGMGYAIRNRSKKK